jgi:hypothetical protein
MVLYWLAKFLTKVYFLYKKYKELLNHKMNPILKELLENTKDACYLPLRRCNHNGSMNMREWLKSFKPLNSNNKQGVVYTAFNEKFGPVIIKHLHHKHLEAHGKREILSGFNLNKLKSPFFMELLGYFFRKSGFYLVSKYVFGDLLKNKISTLDDSEFLSILLQVCVALETAQDKFRFTHYDLHTSNVILQHQEHVTILFDQYTCNFRGTYKPVIIDFGMSCGIDENDKNYGIQNLKHLEIYDKCQPGYDVFTFLVFCKAQLKENHGPYKIINEILLKYFKHNVENHMHTLKKGINVKTPKHLFIYLVNKYRPKYVTDRKEYELVTQKCKINTNSFVDQLYYNRKYYNHLIPNDLNSYLPTPELIKLYFKIKSLKLSNKYKEFKEWEQKFLPTYKQFWKTKLEKNSLERSTFLLN